MTTDFGQAIADLTLQEAAQSRCEIPIREIPMKEWRQAMALEMGVSESYIAELISARAAHKYPRMNFACPVVRRVNKRVVYVQIYQ